MERYDRARASNIWLRIHQEDMCQDLGLHPTRKYENDGGPGVQTIVALLREQSSSPEEDVQSFLDAIAVVLEFATKMRQSRGSEVLLND